MSELIVDISVSVDGFVAGAEPNHPDHPLGIGGDQLHEWAMATRAWREPHGREGGTEGEDSAVMERATTGVGATIMGRRMFSGGEGDWDGDPRPRGWWGDEPPFHRPVFILTSHAREPLPMEGGTTFTFVTDGIESALEQARDAAGDEDIQIAGGASAVQQYLKAGHVDELRLHVAPVLLGDGVRLFAHHDAGAPVGLERTGAIATPSGVVHLTYRRAG
jgi:dihydrofolate reductase